MNSVRTSQVWLKATDRFSVSPSHSCLCGVIEVSLNSKPILAQFAELVQFAKLTQFAQFAHLAQFNKFFSSYR